MITKGGEDWQPTDEQVLQWQHVYDNVDVFAELNQMAAWLQNNEPRRKTMKGMPRFANSWLARANQSGGSPFAQKEQQETGRKPLKQWTQLDDLTHDFMNNERFRQSCLDKYGQYVTLDGQRVTK